MARTTFLFGDSSEHHTDLGTADAFEPVLAALLERVAADGQMLGLRGVSVTGLVERLAGNAPWPPPFSRVLDDYIETHTHGPINLAADADALLLDPSYDDTDIGAALCEAAERHGLRAEWHPGSALTLDTFPTRVPSDGELTRWQRFLADGRAARLAARVIAEHSADGVHLTAAAIGHAARAFQHDPAAWREWGAPDASLTVMKDLWRILVAHGAPLRGDAGSRGTGPAIV